MLYCNIYYKNNTPSYHNFFRGFGLVVGTFIASNVLTNCPKYIDKFAEIYMIGLSISFMYTLYLSVNNKYHNSFWSDFKNSFFITMFGSLIYFHPLSISTV